MISAQLFKVREVTLNSWDFFFAVHHDQPARQKV